MSERLRGLDLVQHDPARRPTVNGRPIQVLEAQGRNGLVFYSPVMPNWEERRAIRDYAWDVEAILADRDRLIDQARD